MLLPCIRPLREISSPKVSKINPQKTETYKNSRLWFNNQAEFKIKHEVSGSFLNNIVSKILLSLSIIIMIGLILLKLKQNESKI
jgi:hypothetical protein